MQTRDSLDCDLEIKGVLMESSEHVILSAESSMEWIPSVIITKRNIFSSLQVLISFIWVTFSFLNMSSGPGLYYGHYE